MVQKKGTEFTNLHTFEGDSQVYWFGGTYSD